MFLEPVRSVELPSVVEYPLRAVIHAPEQHDAIAYGVIYHRKLYPCRRTIGSDARPNLAVPGPRIRIKFALFVFPAEENGSLAFRIVRQSRPTAWSRAGLTNELPLFAVPLPSITKGGKGPEASV